jgi:hypothetical protein
MGYSRFPNWHRALRRERPAAVDWDGGVPHDTYPAYAYAPAGGGYSEGSCYRVQTTIVVNGQQTPAWATACQQPDGSWRTVP